MRVPPCRCGSGLTGSRHEHLLLALQLLLARLKLLAQHNEIKLRFAGLRKDLAFFFLDVMAHVFPEHLTLAA